MSQDTHHMGKTMALKQGQELKSFHFKTQTCINHQKNNIGDFREVDHCPDISRAFYDRYSLFFCASKCDCSIYFINLVLHKVLNQRTDQSRFA